jgi:hypothetical protein
VEECFPFLKEFSADVKTVVSGWLYAPLMAVEGDTPANHCTRASSMSAKCIRLTGSGTAHWEES